MKIIVVDRDDMSLQRMSSKLEDLGHEVHQESIKNDAVEALSDTEIDIVIFDPSPMNNGRPMVLNIRRSSLTYPYIILMSADIKKEEALKMGINDVLDKPINQEDLEVKMDNAQRLRELIARIGDEKEDFPSAGGVIAKSAFNQLFMSAIERADRYAEETHVVFISIENYTDIKDIDGPYAAEFTVSKLAQHLVRLRRQSDIIAQTGKNEYALLLQRPLTPTEPQDAANRFAVDIEGLEDLASNGTQDVEIHVRLISLPVGALKEHHIIKKSVSEA